MKSGHVQVEGIRLHYREMGSGPAVLLLHGWPTSSFLWRDCMPPMAQTNRVIALDLPGFGESDKPLGASYSFRFFDRILTGVVNALGIDELGIAVHDLGGPVGLHWVVHNMDRVRSLALLNTLVYPKPSWAVVAFVAASFTPGLRSYLTSPIGLEHALKLGLGPSSKATPEAIAGVQAPFRTRQARKALLKSAHSLHPGGMKTIAARLPSFPGPVRIIYGAKDRILPDVAETMAQLKRDLPQAETTCFTECGHFLQEERGEQIGRLLGEFFAAG